SVAADRAGNRQALPSKPQATTTIELPHAAAPAAFQRSPRAKSEDVVATPGAVQRADLIFRLCPDLLEPDADFDALELLARHQDRVGALHEAHLPGHYQGRLRTTTRSQAKKC